MFYKIFCFIAKLYTRLAARNFYHFGKGSIIKPFLNSAGEKYISVGDGVNIGSFCRITVSTEFGGHKVESNNDIRIKIGDNVDLGNDTFIGANNDIQIGDHVMFSSYVFVTDHEHGFSDMEKHLHEQPLSEGGQVKIGDNVFIGTKASILKNVSIGEHSVVAASSVVTKDVPAYSIVAGNPARVIKKYDFDTKQWVKAQ